MNESDLRMLMAHFYELAATSGREVESYLRFAPIEETNILILDLVSSTRFRFFRGEEAAFKRTRVLSNVSHGIFNFIPGFHILKELGDGRKRSGNHTAVTA